MPKDIAAEIKALQKMTTGELAERYEELHGQPVRTRHRAYLIRKIAWRIVPDLVAVIARSLHARLRSIQQPILAHG